MSVTADASEWPLVTIRLAGVADRRHSEDLVAELERQLQRGRCAIVLDTTGVTLAEPTTARENLHRESAWLSAHQALVTENAVALGVVCDSASVRFLFSGILALARLPTAWSTSATSMEGRLFCLKALRKAGLVQAPR